MLLKNARQEILPLRSAIFLKVVDPWTSQARRDDSYI